MFVQLEKAEKRYDELEQLMGSSEVVANKELYGRYAKELAGLREPVSLLREHRKLTREIEELRVMLGEKHDKDFTEMAQKELGELTGKLQELEGKINLFLRGEDKDLNKDIIVEIRPGTGGLEAGLFAGDLYRMYTRYAARRNWTVEDMSSHPNEMGGFKEIVFGIKGKDAYKRLKLESGVHRVQRVPSTEAQGRIHTSTATVVVLIEPQDLDFAIEPKDLKIDTYRSSGPGGQHMQKTDSAVRITHMPTGLVVACQDERSQGKNKTKAMRILRARLMEMKMQEEAKRVSKERQSQIGSGDRSEKIRTYNFPDRRVTDHRINFTVHQLEAILEGDMDEISEALIKAEEAAKRHE